MKLTMYGIRVKDTGQLMAIATDNNSQYPEDGYFESLEPDNFDEKYCENIFLNSSKEHVEIIINEQESRFRPQMPKHSFKSSELEVVEVKLTFKK